MTDISSKYIVSYSADQYNSTSTDSICQIDQNLVFPILPVSSDFEVAVNKAKIDLSTVPLTRSNIPLKFYQLGMKAGDVEQTAYVRQVGGNTNNYLYNLSTDFQITKSQYSQSGVLTQVSALSVAQYFGTVGFFATDAYENSYVVGSLTSGATTFNLFYIFDTQGNVLFTSSGYSAIQALTLSRDQRVFIADETNLASQILVYSNVNGLGVVNLTLVETITLDFNGDPLRAIQTVCADLQIVVGSETNKVTIYDSATYAPITTYNEAAITQLSSQSAIASKFDRFVLTSNEVINDSFFGIQAGGSTTMVNCETLTNFGTDPQGEWLNTAKMSVVTQNGAGTAYGIGIDNNTYTLPYDFTTGLAGAYTLANGTQVMDTCVGAQQNTHILSSDGDRNLYGMAIDNGDNYTYSLLDQNFKIGASPPLSWDIQNNSGKITAVGVDNDLYQSSLPIYPKNLMLSRGATNLDLFGVGWNAQNAVSVNAQIQTYTTTWTPRGFYKNGDYAYQLESNGGSIRVQQLQFPNLVINDTYLIPEANVNYADGNTLGFCQIPGGYFAVSNGYAGVTPEQQVFIYSEAGVVQAGVYLPDTNNALPGWFLACGQNAGEKYLIVGAGNLYVVNVTTPNAPAIILNTQLTPGEYFPQYVKGVQWVDATTPYLIVTSADAPTNPGFNLFKVTFTDLSFSQIDYATTVFINVNTYAYNVNPLSFLQSANEIFILVDDGSVEIWNVGSLLQTSTVYPNVNTTNVFYVLPDIGYTYEWVLQTQVTSTVTLGGIAVSQTNPNEIYVTATPAGEVYFGALVSGQYTLVPFIAIPTNFTRINVVPSPTAGYNSKAFNYGISGQNPHGVFNSAGQITGVARNDISGEFLIQDGTNLVSFPCLSFATPNFSVTYAAGNLIWANNGEDIFAGNRDIFNTQTLIDAINVAFVEAFDKFPPNTFAEAPVMTLDYATGLLTLTYSGDYTTVGNGILFNNSLLQICKFPSTVDTINPAFNLLLLKPTSTSTTQFNKSIYLFNKLENINFVSNTIYVVNSYFGNNNTNQVLTSIQVPISDQIDNVGQVLYYQPTFLRPYTLASNNPLQRLQLTINYVYNDGTSYQLLLAPYTAWQCELKFVRKY